MIRHREHTHTCKRAGCGNTWDCDCVPEREWDSGPSEGWTVRIPGAGICQECEEADAREAEAETDGENAEAQEDHDPHCTCPDCILAHARSLGDYDEDHAPRPSRINDFED